MQWHNVGNIYPSSFQNLVQLDFNVSDCNWPMLQDLLQNAPNLETLVVTKVSLFNWDIFSWSFISPKLTLLICCVCCHQEYTYDKSNLCWKEPQYDRDYLPSHLTSFYYGGFEGLKDEEEFVKYILKEARVLKTATIQVYRGKSKENVLEKLSMFPRRSTTCLLRVEWGILL